MEDKTRSIQLKCLEILDIIDSICRQNNIRYSLCGGSVVGAHLYQGCLPWDDDIDLMMTRENYNRFIDIAPKLLPNGYSMHNYLVDNSFHKPFTKITNDNTTIVQKNGDVYGIFIDITVYDRVPKDWRRHIDYFLCRRSLTLFKGTMKVSNWRALLHNLAIWTMPCSKRTYLLFFQKVAERLGKTRRYTYSELFGAWAQTYAYPSHIFENYTDVDFEGRKSMIVRDYVEYLQLRYRSTDFREPKEKQVAPHCKLVDFNMPYKEYLQRQQQEQHNN